MKENSKLRQTKPKPKPSLYQYLINKYFNPGLDLRVQAFNLLSFAGIAAGVVAAITSSITGIGVNVIINLLMSVLAFFFVHLAERKNCYRFCYRLSIIIVFIIAFPYMFFTAGGYHSGMLCYFVFAFVFTALMLDGFDRIAAISAEFIIYTGVCMIAYFRPDTVTFFDTERDFVIDAGASLVVSSTLLLLVILLYVRIYDNRQKQLLGLEKLKTEFLSNMSHELRTPLTGVSGFAQYSFNVLNDDWPLDNAGLDEMRDNLRLIVVESDRMRRIVEQMLDLAAIEQGKFILAKQRMKISELAEGLQGIHFKVLNINNNALDIDIQPDIPDITADRDRLFQVLLNLTSNALRHTKNGVVAIAAKLENGRVALTVSDNGEGIPKDFRDKIFERFLIADIGRAHGTGLGLYICKQIIEAHGGEIWIESEPGLGTAVHFTLPLERVES